MCQLTCVLFFLRFVCVLYENAINKFNGHMATSLRYITRTSLIRTRAVRRLNVECIVVDVDIVCVIRTCVLGMLLLLHVLVNKSGYTTLSYQHSKA